MSWTCAGCNLKNLDEARVCRRCGAERGATATTPYAPPQASAPPANPYAPPQASAPPAKPPAKASPASMAASIGGAVGGIFLSRYFGTMLLVPTLGAFLGGWLAFKLGPARARPMIAAWGVQCGHAAWMLVGGIVGGVMASVAIDLAVLTVGLAWLLARPGLPPALLLGAYQLVAIALHVVQLGSADGDATKALALHVLLRIAALGFLAMGLRTMRRQSAA